MNFLDTIQQLRDQIEQLEALVATDKIAQAADKLEDCSETFEELRNGLRHLTSCNRSNRSSTTESLQLG